MGAFGWGDVFGKIFEWLPGRRESLANRIERLQRKLDEIQKRKPFTLADSYEYDLVANKLRQAIAEAKNN